VGPAGGGQGQGLPRARRVRKRPEYLEIQGAGRRFVGDHYMLFARRASEPARPARFGFTVSRKVGGAVLRNKVKRWLRESCRRMKAEFPDGLDLVIVARPSAAGAGYGPTASELANLARRIRAQR
jgi:ribonuclease P protein component